MVSKKAEDVTDHFAANVKLHFGDIFVSTPLWLIDSRTRSALVFALLDRISLCLCVSVVIFLQPHR
jgi:hypothetical protein